MIRIAVSPYLRPQEHVQITVFKGGEVNVSLNEKVIAALKVFNNNPPPNVRLIANISSSNDLMALMLVVNAIRNIEPRAEISATIPYFPYARQDRICNPGEALSVAVVANMINSLNLTKVTIVDPHSTVTPALINNVEVQSQEQHLKAVLGVVIKDYQNLHVMAPDQGAYKKVFDIASKNDFAGFLYASKDRDPKTMEIKSVTIHGDVKDKHILVLDDICDGGRTFIELGARLWEAGAASIQLFVTHGIFSYGIEPLCEMYDKIYTTDSFHPCVDGRQPNAKLTNDKLVWISL